MGKPTGLKKENLFVFLFPGQNTEPDSLCITRNSSRNASCEMFSGGLKLPVIDMRLPAVRPDDPVRVKTTQHGMFERVALGAGGTAMMDDVPVAGIGAGPAAAIAERNASVQAVGKSLSRIPGARLRAGSTSLVVGHLGLHAVSYLHGRLLFLMIRPYPRGTAMSIGTIPDPDSS